MARKFTATGRTENRYIKQRFTQLGFSELVAFHTSQHSSGIMQLHRLLPEGTEDPSRWEMLPFPFSRVCSYPTTGISLETLARCLPPD